MITSSRAIYKPYIYASMAVALLAFFGGTPDAHATKASECIDYLNLSNQFGGRLEFKNRCSKTVSVQFCLVPDRGGRIRRGGTLPARSTRYIDFQSYEGRATLRLRACFQGQHCGSIDCP